MKHFLFLFLLLWPLSLPSIAATAEDREQRFLMDMARDRMLTADTKEEFENTAGILRRISLRTPNGQVFYNLGTCLLLTDQNEEAFRALSRAERYLGSTPELLQNLHIARQKKNSNGSETLPWYRIPLFWHYALPFAARRDIALAAFCAFWLALTLRALNIRNTASLLMAASILLLVTFGSSSVTTWMQEQHDRSVDPVRYAATSEPGGKP